jgi:homoserine kinase type II
VVVSTRKLLLETTTSRFILTLYEARTDPVDLPWFIALMQALSAGGLAVPRPISDRTGVALQMLEGRPACLIEFLPGVSISRPTAAQCRAIGTAAAALHRAGERIQPGIVARPNALGVAAWRAMADGMGGRMDLIQPGLYDRVAREIDAVTAAWPHDLPGGIIHADLFPDNVLMLGGQVTGLIDFYFACTDLLAYDIAIIETAWCFAADGTGFDAGRAAALRAGYGGLGAAETAAMPVLARGACLRFLLSRAQDWLDTPADALVTRKDPIAYLRRLDHYAR